MSTQQTPPTDTAVEQDAAARGLFVRRSSGLVRDMGLAGAFGSNFGFLNLAAAIGTYALVLSLFPGSDLAFPLIIAGIGTGMLCFVYAQLVSAMPRSGGDYVFVSRVLHPALGSMIGAALVILFCVSMGVNATFFAQQFISFAVRTLGSELGISGLTSLAEDIPTRTGTLITGSVLILGGGAIAALGIRTAGRVLFWLAVSGAIGVVIAILWILFTTRGGFVSTFNDASGSSSAYNDVIAAARDTGFDPGIVTSATLTSIPFCAILYWGFTYTSFSGGEVKSPARTTLISSLAAVVLGTSLFVLGYLAFRKTFGLDFFQASSVLSFNDPDALAEVTSVSVGAQDFATLLMANPVTNILLAWSFLAFSLLPFVVWCLITSRTLFAMSFDRLLPEGVAAVRGRRHSPLVALAIATLGGLGFLITTTYSTGVAQAFRNQILIVASIFLVASITAAVLPWRRPQLFEGSPKVVRGSWLGLPPTTWFAAGAALFHGFVVFMTLTKGEYSGGYDTTSTLTVIGTVTLGLALYLIAKALMGQRGVDTGLAMRELPPE